ncbi:MAG: hypothetical protein ACC619_07550, partial [Paracoccaceae bacterium]
MSTDDREQWLAANHRYLVAEIDRLRALLARRVEAKEDNSEGAQLSAMVEDARRDVPGSAALEMLVSAFGLSSFEKELLLLLAAVELDGATAELSARFNGDSQRRVVTYSLALACLPDAHWSAITPGGALRHWRLVEVGPGETLTQSPLRIDEWALHFLTGTMEIDSRLQAVLTPLSLSPVLTPSQAEQAEAVAQLWREGGDLWSLPMVQLCGNAEMAEHIAGAACAIMGWSAFRLNAEDLASTSVERESFIRLWEREMLLHGCVLFVAADDLDGPEQTRHARSLLGRVRGGVVAAVQSVLSLPSRRSVSFPVPTPSTDEQRELWHRALGPMAQKLNGDVDRLVNQFRLEPLAIMNVGTAFRALSSENASDPGSLLWSACRRQARPRLEEL